MDFYSWCKSCRLNHFQINYGKSPSGIDKIDKILKDNYSESRKTDELVKWIPYNEFKDITNIVNEESFGLCSAIWYNGYISNWNKDKLNWNREFEDLKVTLMSFENSDDLFSYVKVSFF